MSAIAEWAAVAGVGRDVLEARLRAAVEVVEAVERRLAGRAEQNEKIAALHPDGRARDASTARARAYRTAAEDLHGAALDATRCCSR